MGSISSTILSHEDGKAKYDAVQKELLSNRQILAHIVKRFVKEFEDVPLKDIEEKYIEPESIRVSKVFVEKNMTNLTEEQIEGLNTEDTSINEGRVTYDILFHVKYPDGSGEEIGMYINLEAQTAFYPGYPIEVRGVYYSARKFTSQLRSIRKGTDYGKLKKVYSIWLCMGDVPKEEANTATLYRFEKDDIIGRVERDRRDYDLINVVVVRINDRVPSEDGTLAMLQSLCSNELKKEEKLRKLEGFGLRVKGAIEGGVERMCNLSELVEKRGEERGLKLGEERGLKLGEERGLREGILLGEERGLKVGEERGLKLGEERAKSTMAISMLRDGMAREQVAKYAGVSVETLKQWELEALH
ncbi:MAG: hypothetical protein Q4C63_08765 [Eubacteriales bacterium]|nr:hypothetical protein [Eubacteriales bacterium]